LTTYQHHFIDVPTGLWAGLFVLWLFPKASQSSLPSRDTLRFRIGAAYVAAGAMFTGAAVLIGGAGWGLLWPGAALILVGIIYFVGRAELFRKSDGRLPASSLILFAPYWFSTWLNSRRHTRREPPAQEIADGIWLGRSPLRAERDGLGICSVVDVTAELPIDKRGIDYRGVPMLDLLAPTTEQIEAAVQCITELRQQRPTLVCCALGYSRSAAAVIAWLLAAGKAESIDAAISLTRTRRPSIIITGRHRLALQQWAAERFA
jgi:protein-tyrosine phosphatase